MKPVSHALWTLHLGSGGGVCFRLHGFHYSRGGAGERESLGAARSQRGWGALALGGVLCGDRLLTNYLRGAMAVQGHPAQPEAYLCQLRC